MSSDIKESTPEELEYRLCSHLLRELMWQAVGYFENSISTHNQLVNHSVAHYSRRINCIQSGTMNFNYFHQFFTCTIEINFNWTSERSFRDVKSYGSSSRPHIWHHVEKPHGARKASVPFSACRKSCSPDRNSAKKRAGSTNPHCLSVGKPAICAHRVCLALFGKSSTFNQNARKSRNVVPATFQIINTSVPKNPNKQPANRPVSGASDKPNYPLIFNFGNFLRRLRSYVSSICNFPEREMSRIMRRGGLLML